MEQRMKQAIWPQILSRAQAAAGKYKIPILVLMLGALLLLLPSGGKAESRVQTSPDAEAELTDLQTQLQALLEQMIEKGLSSEERQEGIYFADNLEEIRRILSPA